MNLLLALSIFHRLRLKTVFITVCVNLSLGWFCISEMGISVKSDGPLWVLVLVVLAAMAQTHWISWSLSGFVLQTWDKAKSKCGWSQNQYNYKKCNHHKNVLLSYNRTEFFIFPLHCHRKNEARAHLLSVNFTSL